MKNKLWNRVPNKPFNLQWWLHLHKLALFEAHLNENPSRYRKYVYLANWIAHRIERNYERKEIK